MSAPELLRVLCHKSRPHTLAVVQASADGDHIVIVTLAVTVGANEYEGHKFTVPLSEMEGRMAYCNTCKHAYMLDDGTIRHAISLKVRRMSLEPRGFLADPMRVLQQRHGALPSTP